jgi:hypothetical protein
VGDSAYLQDGDVANASLDVRHVGTVDAGLGGQVLLGPPLRRPSGADLPPMILSSG